MPNGFIWLRTMRSRCQRSGSTPGTPHGIWRSIRLLSAWLTDFAERQLELMLQEVHLQPNGQIPAYKWNFGDVNTPVHAWAVHYLFVLERQQRGKGDFDFLKDASRKLLLNFTCVQPQSFKRNSSISSHR